MDIDKFIDKIDLELAAYKIDQKRFEKGISSDKRQKPFVFLGAVILLIALAILSMQAKLTTYAIKSGSHGDIIIGAITLTYISLILFIYLKHKL